MQTPFRPSYLIFALAVQILHFFTNASGQDIEATIEIRAENQTAIVSGVFREADRNLSFVRSFAGFDALGERVKDLDLKDADNRSVAFQASVPGEYVSTIPFKAWRYSIDLSPRKQQTAAAHVSWISANAGLLMLRDLLPSKGQSSPVAGIIKVNVPSGWYRLENRIGGIINTKDVYSEVVAIGKDLKFRRVQSGNTSIAVGHTEDWLFTSDELVEMCRQIHTQLRTNFGSEISNEVFVNVLKFPQQVGPGQWQAETRGKNVTIISSDMPFKTQSQQRLHEQLRHEMFHLWIPNGVNLSGDYDWFYEGFALYTSLKMAVAMNRIRFEDFLDTLSRAYSIDSRQTNRLSLIDATNKRWNGADTYIYARGMVTAFLCDVLLLHNSKGKRSVNDVIRDFYSRHKYPALRTDGNAAALEILRGNKELAPIIEKYVKSSDKFAWEPELSLAGLEMKNGIAVILKPSGKQKDLLDALGYNNWRKLSPRK
jgi:hypothetical protein